MTTITQEDAIQIAGQYYGIVASAKPLNGYEEQNFLLTTVSGEKYILKAASQDFNLSLLQAHTSVIRHLATTALKDAIPSCISNIEGQSITHVEINHQVFYVRILNYLEGHFWVDELNKTPGLYQSFGELLGRMDYCMKDLYFDALDRKYVWDNNRVSDAEQKLHYITEPEKRRLAGYFILQFKTEVEPILPELRYASIHGDANDYNVLVRNGRVAGFIDFGDLIWSALINNLAIACTYAMLHTDNPLDVATLIVKGYHQAYSLQPQEVDVLYYLIAGRLCISVTQSAEQTHNNSVNEHHFLTEQYAWDLLQQLIRINPLKAANSFRKACSMEPTISEYPDHKALIDIRRTNLGYNLSLSYRTPLKIVKGALQYLYDDRGMTYIDCVNNVSHVGHCHPVVVKAMQKQIAKLNTNTRYLNDEMMAYAQELTSLLPSKLSVCYFVNSGSEANDLAIRMARHFTHNQDVVVLDHAYHGTSTLAIELSPYKFDGKGGNGAKPYIHKVPSPDLYRGEYRYDDPVAGKKYADQVGMVIQDMVAQSKSPAAFICETLLGVGGQIPLPDGYLPEVYDHIRRAGGVCIADEVQVGFGRVGKAFWGFQLQEVEPDIVVLGKPIGNGHPLAAVIVTSEIAAAFDNGMEYFNTFGGNPVSMVAGRSVLKIIEEEKLQQNAFHVGKVLLEGFHKLMDQFPIIGDVRGHGLFVGVELVKDRISQSPAVPEIDNLVERMKEKGYLLSTDGPLHNVLKIKPPIVFSEQNALDLLEDFKIVLEQFYKENDIIS